MSSCVTVTVLVAPVARLTISSRKSGLDEVPRLTAEAVTPASSALMALARPSSVVVASTATLCTVPEPTWNWNVPGPLATVLDADATPTVAPATEPCARCATVSVTLPGWAPAPAAAASTSVSLDVAWRTSTPSAVSSPWAAEASVLSLPVRVVIEAWVAWTSPTSRARRSTGRCSSLTSWSMIELVSMPVARPPTVITPAMRPLSGQTRRQMKC